MNCFPSSFPPNLFPADDIGEGFNRTASLLRMSPLLTEKYMEAAEQVAAMALDPNPARRFPPSQPKASIWKPNVALDVWAASICPTVER